MTNSPAFKAARRLFVSSAFMLAVACSGGGSQNGGGSTANPPSGGGGGTTGPTWTSGVYQPASQFKNRCQTVRTGVDIEGNPFPDQSGSTLYENFWLRSWTHETYLWNDEVTDRNPANYNDRLQYFDLLRTTAQTSSGKDKDQFHFSQPTDEYLEQRNSEPASGYGASFVAFSATPPRDFRVQYTEPNSPASDEIMGQPNFQRGSKILEIDGVDLVNANSQSDIDTLNNGLFPATAGEMHTFVVEDPGSAGTRTFIITSADIAPSAVNRMRVIDTASGKVGYALINTFSPFASEKQIADAIAALSSAGINDLFLDLRYNGGGLVAVSAQLGYMVAGSAQSSGKTFEGFRFNAAAGNTNPVTGETNSHTPFYSTGLGFSLADGAPLTSLNLPRVFVLSTGETCSASESVINALRGIDVDVILIGETTCGKPYGFYPEDNCGETYYTVQFQGVNQKGFGDYADGFIPNNSNAAFGVRIPGCSVADDYTHELGDDAEALLAAALQYRTNGSCPSPVAQAPSGITANEVNAATAPVSLTPGLYVMRHNRDMRMPE